MTNDNTRLDGVEALGDDMILVPILLRADGITARIHFPANLTEAEAEKISRVIKAYAVLPPPPSVSEEKES
jgi:hypothetical protein